MEIATSLTALKIAVPSRPARAVIELDEDRNVDESLRKKSVRTVTEELQNRNVLLYDKSTYDDVNRLGGVHIRTRSFLTLSNRRKKAKSVVLPSLVPNQIPGVKNEDVIKDADPATMMQLSDSTRISYDRLGAALLPVCLAFDVLFQELFKALKVFGDDIS